MTEPTDVLAALGHPARLQIFRILWRAGENGMALQHLSAEMNMPTSTLKFHLQTLLRAKLINNRKEGRELYLHAVMRVLREAIDFLEAECCADQRVVRKQASSVKADENF